MTESSQAVDLPDPPIEPEVTLAGFERIDMPIDWLGEDWALSLSSAGLGAVFRLFTSSLRQCPAGSLPGSDLLVKAAVAGPFEGDDLREALALWELHSDGRRYWPRIVPLIEEAWSRRRGKTSKDATRKRRERLRDQLIKAGCTPTGAANADVQAMVWAELGDDARLTLQNVVDAATRAGVIGPIRPLRRDVSGQSEDCPKVSGGQLLDSHGTVTGQFSDSPDVSDPQGSTRYGVARG